MKGFNKLVLVTYTTFMHSLLAISQSYNLSNGGLQEIG